MICTVDYDHQLAEAKARKGPKPKVPFEHMPTLTQVVKEIKRTEGFRGFWKCFSLCLVRNGMVLGVIEFAKQIRFI